MDALSDVLRVVRLSGAVFLEGKMTAPWGVRGNVEARDFAPFHAQPNQVIGFHYVVSGEMLARVGDDGAFAPIKAGEIVLFPRNDIHTLASAEGVAANEARDVEFPPLGSGIFCVEAGGGGDETRIVCGFLGTDSANNPLIESLPPMLVLNVADTPGGAWIAQSFAFAAREVAGDSVGGATMIAKLSELMFVEAVRRYVDALPEDQTGWLAGLRDPAVGRALALIHTRPSEEWSAEDLAREVGLSRSAFGERFAALIGMPPIKYLTNWRMQVAAQKLRENRLSIAQIAYDIGYESEAAFTRAFRREMGAPPGAWRTQALEAPAP